MNWGKGIVVAFTLFAAFIIYLVIRSTQVQVDLVAEDYYAREVAFQSHINKVERAKRLKEKISWQVTGNQVNMHYPAAISTDDLAGTIRFYRPSDQQQDFSTALELKPGNRQTISFASMPTGLYRLQLDWSLGGVTYFQEGNIVIN